jgi:hypothetical protein
MEGYPLIASAEEFVELRNSEHPASQRRAAREEADVDVWLDVIAKYPEMRRWVAHNKTVPASILQQLATDPDAVVRWAVAGKRKLSSAVLQRLAHDPDDSVRVRVARHRSAPAEMLEMLAQDESWVVREAAIANISSRSDPGR